MTEPKSLDLEAALSLARGNVPSIYDLVVPMLKALRPQSYLEMGLGCHDNGHTFTPARIYARRAVCIDPSLEKSITTENSALRNMSPGQFFSLPPEKRGYVGRIGLAYLKDTGWSLRAALSSFAAVEQHSNMDTVVVVDGAIPPNGMATDLWKLYPALNAQRHDLELTLVNVKPAGALVITKLDARKALTPEGIDSLLEGTSGWGPSERDFAITALLSAAATPNSLVSKLNLERWGRSPW
jgi:hypothetical protein